jgi:flagellar M-ring protein FliF
VDEADLYKARMLVAQNGALAMPDTASDSLDKLPMGASALWKASACARRANMN